MAPAYAGGRPGAGKEQGDPHLLRAAIAGTHIYFPYSPAHSASADSLDARLTGLHCIFLAFSYLPYP
jgi:hypothetical protein